VRALHCRCLGVFGPFGFYRLAYGFPCLCRASFCEPDQFEQGIGPLLSVDFGRIAAECSRCCELGSMVHS